MSAYWLARSKVNNPEGYKRYTDLVPDILKKYGGKALSRGGNYQIMEGPEYFTRFIVIEFPSMKDATACFESEEYPKLEVAKEEHHRPGIGLTKGLGKQRPPRPVPHPRWRPR